MTHIVHDSQVFSYSPKGVLNDRSLTAWDFGPVRGKGGGGGGGVVVVLSISDWMLAPVLISHIAVSLA